MSVVQFSIHPPPNSQQNGNILSLTSYATLIQDYVSSSNLLPADFLWHKDPWNLRVADQEAALPHLEGYLRVGDCIDDEWVLIFLLKSISAHWPELCISVFDQDGDFLLIEAAEHLPKWVTPENSDNRVWIANGQVHLIPLEFSSSFVNGSASKPRRRRVLPGQEDHSWLLHSEKETNEWLSIDDALKCLWDPLKATRAPHLVEQTIWERISRYPDALPSHVHHTSAYIHSDVAKALTVNPALMQKAIEMFYTRDSTQLRAAHRMSRFPPSGFALASVRMTRLAYAQLKSQKFFPPKIFGRWEGDAGREGTIEWRRRDIGMKITVGFEMLYQETKNIPKALQTNPNATSSAISATLDTLRRTEPYKEYINNLVSRTSYFRGSLEGSQLWLELEQRAATTFLEITKDSPSTSPFAVEVTQAIAHFASQNPLTPALREDSEEWLNTVPPSDDGMDVDQPTHREATEDGELEAAAEKMQNFAKQMQNFVEKQGDIEGALAGSDVDSDDEDEDLNDSDSEDSDHDASSNGKVRGNADDLVAPLLPGEYGKMPADFYERSQKVAEPPPTAMKEANDTGGAAKEGEQNEASQSSRDAEERFERLRRPIFVRDAFDGVDSDDESSEASEDYGIDPLEKGDSDVDTDEDHPQVEDQGDELEVDMGQEEEDFLEFSRKALGIEDDHWASILAERQDRGAYVPPSKRKERVGLKKKEQPNLGGSNSGHQADSAEPSGPRKRQELDSFEAVMQAMDTELSRFQSQQNGGSGEGKGKGKGKGRAKVLEEDDEIEVEMDEELRRILENGGEGEEEGFELGSDTSINYNLIKNFLESYGGQDGANGPVGGLMAMLEPGLAQKVPKE